MEGNTFRRFVFVKPFNCEFGRIQSGFELSIMNDMIFLNGGPIEPWYYNFFHKFISDEMQNPNYLKEMPIIYNKI